MRARRNRGALRTFGLVFAIALAPALMQSELGCPPSGDARLEILNVAESGMDMIAFEPDEYVYEVMLPEDTGVILVRAEAMNGEAAVSYNINDGCEMLMSEELPAGGGFFVLESVPEGHSFLNIWVKAPEGRQAKYVIVFAQPEQCE